VGDRASGRLDDACGLMTEQEREFVVDAARRGRSDRCGTPRTPGCARRRRSGRDRDDDVDELDGSALAAGDDALNLLWHAKTSLVVDREKECWGIAD
jgi:hypothetical protein